IAGIIILIVFLTTNNSNTSNSKALAPQAKANQVAVAAGRPASTTTPGNTQKYSAAPAMTIDTSKTYTAKVVTTAGTFTIGLDPKAAPVTVNSFVFLADKNYYHCVIFHRVIPT